MKILATLSVIALAAGCACAQQTQMLTADKHNEYGVVYSLPLTQLVFDIEAQHTVSKAGPFFRYADKYVGTTDVVKADAESWTVKNVKMYVQGIPGGPERTYLMQVKPGVDLSVCVAGEGDGMLLGINRNVDYTPVPQAPETNSPAANAQADAAVKNYLQYVDEEFLASQSNAMRARLLSETLMTVREARLSLSRGTAETMPTDGRQLELMLNSLGDQDKALSQAFTGTTVTETLNARYYFLPDTVGGTGPVKKVLARLSDFAGFTDADDLTGDPLYISLEYITVPELPSDDKGMVKRIPKDGVVYTLPSTAKVTLTWKGTTIFTSTVDLAQNGVTFGIDPKLFTDRKEPYEATFDPSTGALLRLSRKEK